MKLGIPERVMLLGLLPAQGSIVTLRVVNELRAALSFSEKEISKSKIQQEGDKIQWDPKVDPQKEVTIGDAASTVIKDALKKMDTDGTLTQMHVPIWDKFMV